MSAAVRRLHAVLADDAGASLAEYAMIAGALGVLMIAAFKLIQSETGAQLVTTAGGLTAIGVTPP